MLSSASRSTSKRAYNEANISFRRTHDLSELLDLALTIDPAWDSLRTDLNSLSAFAVECRYPGESASIDEAREALERCRKVRQIMRRALGLE